MDFNNIFDYIVNYNELSNSQKVRNFLIVLGVIVVSIPLEIMYLKYIDKTYGDSDSGLWIAYTMLQSIVIFTITGLSFGEQSQSKEMGCLHTIIVLIVAGAIIIAKGSFVKSQIKSFEEQALSNSYYTIGLITKKDYLTSKSGTTYYLWAGQNDSLAKSHTVSEKMYKWATVGDTIILKVSKEYPRINEVIIWEPSGYEIARYRDENNK